MTTDSKTVRLLMPQWQGGNNAAYPLGARLLDWLAPDSDDVQLEVPIAPCVAPSSAKDKGVVERQSLLKQLHSVRSLLEAHEPDRVVVFGGDCLVEQGPISYLNQRHDGNLGVLWIDAHPDIATPEQFPHAHTYVLGNLLGEGDAEFADQVPVKLKPENVMFAGLQETTEHETAMIERLGIRSAGPTDLATTSQPVLDWIRDADITHLSIHLDLDVLDPKLFRSLLFANPIPDPDTFMDYSQGAMTFDELTRLVKDVSAATEVVSLGIAEHMPWEAINLQRMLQQFPLL